jgi:hypothetical protein
MKIENAIKKLSKYGKVEHNDHEWWIERSGYIIAFLQNGTSGNTCCEYTRPCHMHSDSQSDYFVEHYHDNLTQAIDYVLRREKEKEAA